VVEWRGRGGAAVKGQACGGGAAEGGHHAVQGLG
jgi:hypothetical protein